MKNTLSKRQTQLIEDHNNKMKIISDTAKANNISESTLHYAAMVGIIGVDWIIN